MGELLEMNKTKLNKIGKLLNSLIIIFGTINIVLGMVNKNIESAVACIAVVLQAVIIRGLENE